jgi:hypothetical protein
MELPEKPEWFEIPRQNIKLEYEIQGRTFLFSKTNTMLYLFKEPYDQLNHIFYMEEDGSYSYFFKDMAGIQEIMDELYEFGYHMECPPWPADTDVEAWLIWEKFKLEYYLDNDGFEK